ncbi:MAG: cache domain-containing protein [Pseudomonadota bacterium]
MNPLRYLCRLISITRLSGSLRILIPMYSAYIIFALCVFLLFIPQQRRQLLDQKKHNILQLTDNAISLLAGFDSRTRTGEMTPEKAYAQASDQIRNLRYGPQGKDYFWIIDMHPAMIMHPFRPDLEGADLTDFRDIAGNYPFAAMVEAVKQGGESGGYVNYYWQWKDNPGKTVPKISYVKRFPPWNWIIGTGIYEADINREISTITRSFIQIFTGMLVFIVILSLYITRQVFKIETRRALAEEERALEELRLKKLLELGQMSEKKISALTEFALEEAISLTRSEIGYLAFLNEDETQLTMHTWSKQTMKQCEIQDKHLVYDVEHAGLWAEAARSRQTVIINDYDAYSSFQKKGYPVGHVKISRVLNIPVFDGNTMIALAGVGNKKADYNDSDVRQLKLLMDGMYKILQRKKAEDDLRQSENRYRLLAENATDTIWILELSNFKFTYASPSMEQLSGYSPERLKEIEIRSLINEDSLKRISAIIAKELERDTINGIDASRYRTLEMELIRQDGSTVWTEVTARFLRNDQGTPDRVLGITRDITRRRELEQKLLETNTDLRMAQGMASIGNWSLDPAKDVPVWSDEVYRIYERDPALGPFSLAQYQSVYHGKWLTLFNNSIQGAINNGIPYDIECKMTLPSGRVKWVHGIGEPRKVENKTHWYLRATVQDITDRKNMELHIQQARKMEALGTLAGGIAHDFNNILSSIMGFTELAKLGAKGDQEQRENLDQVLTAGLRARELVKHILTFSRKADVRKDIIRVVPLIKETLKFIRASISPNIQIQTQFMHMDCTVLADPTQMHQVLMNLFTNAAYAMGDRGGVLTVKLDCSDFVRDDSFQTKELIPGNHVRLRVSDTGTGIEQGVIDKIFEPFFTTKVRGEGTGMGLSLVYGIIKEMKGDISVYSEPGKGTTFQILLPEMGGNHGASLDVNKTSLKEGKGKILLIDDETSSVQWMSQVLSKTGYEVVGETGSPEALELFKKDPMAFDLVLTDLTMPGLTGLELSGLVKEIRPDIPIILCTGFSGELTREEMKHYGINQVLMKPMIASELSEAISNVLKDKTGLPHGKDADS